MPVPVTEAVNPRRLIRDEVFLRLLDAIVDGDLLPGEQLYDAEIEKWVGVSRTPVREALNQLAAMGLVEILPQKRTRVTPIDPVRLRGLLETLGPLLQGIVRDTTPLLTDGDKEALQAFAASFADDDIDQLVRNNLLTEGFVNVYIRRLDNKTVARVASRHLPELRRALKAAPTDKVHESSLPFILAAVKASVGGDARAAAAAVGDYTKAAVTELVDAFTAEKKDN
ncbi:GntR family transcriptional regulator [Leifsonia sp. NPDC058292]|uniref:GntR family transcriptional regulator n=1 Tax=Leifsonia sp. NPDC058292 TaxID=3346428 RepID=UPI0036DC96BC